MTDHEYWLYLNSKVNPVEMTETDIRPGMLVKYNGQYYPVAEVVPMKHYPGIHRLVLDPTHTSEYRYTKLTLHDDWFLEIGVEEIEDVYIPTKWRTNEN